MGHIEATKDLSVSAAALWATLSDPTTWDKWFTIHEKWLQEPPATLEEGAMMSEKIMMLGMANQIQWKVEKVHAPASLTISGTGMGGVRCQFEFAMIPSGAGSQFGVAGDFEGALFNTALGKAVEKDGVKQLDRALVQLEALALASVAA